MKFSILFLSLICMVFVGEQGMLYSQDAQIPQVPLEEEVSLEEQSEPSPLLVAIVTISEKMRGGINSVGLKVENAMEFSINKTSEGILYVDGIVEDVLAKISGSQASQSLRDKSYKTIDDIRTSPVATTIGDTTKKAYTDVGKALDLPTVPSE